MIVLFIHLFTCMLILEEDTFLLLLCLSVLTVLEMAFLQELIKDQVANMYLWPKTLEVPIMDPAKYVLAFLKKNYGKYFRLLLSFV